MSSIACSATVRADAESADFDNRNPAWLEVKLTGYVTVEKTTEVPGEYGGNPISCDPSWAGWGTCGGWVYPDEVLTLTPAIGDGWTFTGWRGLACSGTGACTFAVTADIVEQKPDTGGANWVLLDAIAEPAGTSSPLVTLSELGLPAEVRGNPLRVCDLSDDGRYVTYINSRNIPGVGTYHALHRHDLNTGDDIVIDDDGYDSCESVMSADGQFIFWRHVPSVGGWLPSLYVWVAATDTNDLVATGASGPSISSDARFVAYHAHGDPATSFRVLDRMTSGSVTIDDPEGFPFDYLVLGDGSAVVRNLRFYDPISGALMKSEHPADSYRYTTTQASPDGRFLLGLRWPPGSQGGDGELFRLDTITDEMTVLGTSTHNDCTQFRSSMSRPDASGRALFTMAPSFDNIAGVSNSLLADGQFDFYGLYWADVVDGSPAISSATSITLPLVQGFGGATCPSVVSSSDGSKVVYATQRAIPRPNPTAAGVGAATDAGGDALVVMERESGPTLAVTKAGNGRGEVAAASVGLDCGPTCAVATVEDSSVTLTAVPDKWSRFTGWSGACSGTGSCTVTMDQVRSVTATFALRDTLLPFEQPIRVVDTRPLERGVLETTTDEATRFAAGEVRRYVVAPAVGVPSGTTLALNIVARLAQGTGWLKAYPCASVSTPAPAVSYMNVTAGVTLANGGLVKTDAGGGLCIKTSVATDVIIDTTGWFPNLSTFRPLAAPVRLLDTRRNTVLAERGVLETVDETSPFGSTTVRRYVPVNKAGIPASGVAALEVNVVAAQPATNGELRLYPCASTTSTASTVTSVTFRAGTSIATNAVVHLDASGGFCVRSTGSTHVVIDTPGWFGTAAGYSTFTSPSLPKRLVDTRAGLRGALETADTTSPLTGGVTYRYPLAGKAGFPAAANLGAVGITITVLTPTLSGNVAIWPCANTGVTPPKTSIVNFRANVPISNGAIMTVAPTDGGVCVRATSATHITLDTTNWFGA